MAEYLVQDTEQLRSVASASTARGLAKGTQSAAFEAPKEFRPVRVSAAPGPGRAGGMRPGWHQHAGHDHVAVVINRRATSWPAEVADTLPSPARD